MSLGPLAGPGCLFCQIAQGEVPADVVHEDDDIVAFRDIRPKYRTHILLVPKVHVSSAGELRSEHDALAGKLLRVGAELAQKEGITDSGFRLLLNTGRDSGQVIAHLHVHLVGGEPLRPL